ncbi:DUF262 domain-containing protein [Paraglaciecola sp. 20A4]|uniref:DUF262 domain-containing protein n=1 Tax=Paraglaciecola sp. 20A4 TaxID=2687288 RepID=UPI0014098CAE|nr:DUF262 domain-containing protein [Paraglaciecola sp. 20A4]
MNKEYKEELSEDGTKTGIEADIEEESILEPFDPDSISIEQKVVAMDALIRRLKQNSIHLSPDFQRKEVWDLTRRSRLIESLILKIPLPMFYVAANEEGQWEVVDGLQRLSTIRDFLIGNQKGEPLKLRNLEFLDEKFKGKTYSDIESDPSQFRLINTIMETEMRFTVINPGTSEEVKRNIFKRINTGGLPLTAQEIRHALYQGQSSNLLADLVSSEAFEGAINSNINDTRMGVRELVLRFLAFLIFSRKSYKASMDGFLSNAMRVINCMPELEENRLNKIYGKEDIPDFKYKTVKDLKMKFELAMVRAEALFGKHAFRKSLPDNKKKAPVNKALFETWSNILCELSADEFNVLMSKSTQLLSAYKVLFNSMEFNNSISRHASQAKGISHRHLCLSALVHNTISGSEND